MCSRSELDNILRVFSEKIKMLFGGSLREIILFGSYARGDYEETSDVDIAIIADIPHDIENTYNDRIIKILGDIYEDFDYSVTLSPIVISFQFFNEWKIDLPFYKNVDTEGVRIVA